MVGREGVGTAGRKDGVGSTLCPSPSRKADTRLVDGRRSLYIYKKESSRGSRDEQKEEMSGGAETLFRSSVGLREERRKKRLGRGRLDGCVIGLLISLPRRVKGGRA